VGKLYRCESGDYEVHTEEVDGLCIPPNDPGPGWLLVNGRLRGKRRMGALVHEWLEAELQGTPHERIYAMEATLTEILWDQGYRRQKERRK